MTVSGTQDTTSSPLGMRFRIDAWDVSYGTAFGVADEDREQLLAELLGQVGTKVVRVRQK